MKIEDDGFQERVESAVARAGGATEVARRTGFSESTIHKWMSGVSDPSRKRLLALAEACDVPLLWLATGGEAPASGEADAALVDGTGNKVFVEAKYKGGTEEYKFVLLPRYEVRAAAGSGALIQSEQVVDYLAFKREWVVNRLRRNPTQLVLIEAFGNSMEPKIRHGDLLLVDIGVERIRDHAIYALNVGGELVVKYVSRRPSGTVRVFSENETYPPDELTYDEAAQLVVVGQVIWSGGLL